MTLKEALDKFESGRESPNDYACVYLKENGHTRMVADPSEIERLSGSPVAEYAEFRGMRFGFPGWKRLCRGVSVKVGEGWAK